MRSRERGGSLGGLEIRRRQGTEGKEEEEGNKAWRCTFIKKNEKKGALTTFHLPK